jgi:hypothetical protein
MRLPASKGRSNQAHRHRWITMRSPASKGRSILSHPRQRSSPLQTRSPASSGRSSPVSLPLLSVSSGHLIDGTHAQLRYRRSSSQTCVSTLRLCSNTDPASISIPAPDFASAPAVVTTSSPMHFHLSAAPAALPAAVIAFSTADISIANTRWFTPERAPCGRLPAAARKMQILRNERLVVAARLR